MKGIVSNRPQGAERVIRATFFHRGASQHIAGQTQFKPERHGDEQRWKALFPAILKAPNESRRKMGPPMWRPQTNTVIRQIRPWVS